MLLEHNMNVPRFSYLTTFGDEPFLRKLCKKKALLKRAFFIYIQYYPPLRNKILSNRKRKRCCRLQHLKTLDFHPNTHIHY